MSGINRVVLVGRTTADPVLRKTPSNASVATFTLAIDRLMGQGKERQTDFINCVIWNRPAEVAAQYALKGSLVGVEGRIQTRNYTNNQGTKVYVTEVVCDSLQLLGSKNNNGSTTSPTIDPMPSYTEPDYSASDDSADPFPSLDISEEDLPF